MSTTHKTYAFIAFLVILIGIVSLLNMQKVALASVPYGNEYFATSTANSTVYGAWLTGRLVKGGAGTLGQVVIEGANTGVINIYNATTTDVSARTGNKATSTILIASFPASTAAGTYTFDAAFSDGLYIDLVSGNMPTSTVLYR